MSDSKCQLLKAAEELLEFVRNKYPEDFKEGGKGFLCPYHIALDKAVKDCKGNSDLKV